MDGKYKSYGPKSHVNHVIRRLDCRENNKPNECIGDVHIRSFFWIEYRKTFPNKDIFHAMKELIIGITEKAW